MADVALEAPRIVKPEDVGDWYVRGSTGTMAPFSAFATTDWTAGPAQLGRYNGQPSLEIQGQSAPGQIGTSESTTGSSAERRTCRRKRSLRGIETR